jgi:DNA-directed RNA polymerase I, II, and III subunit RPABC2
MKLVEYITIFREFYVIIMARSKSKTQGTKVENTEVDTNQNNSAEVDDSLDKAIKIYTKIYGNEEMLEGSKEQKELDRAIEVIKNRKIITESVDHEPVEIKNSTGVIATGPPTLTRFEKARIMGSRALQLSLGAPPFIDFSKNISTSLEIAMEELHQKVIPIVIRRTLPNGDYQNIAIEQFE